MHTLDFENPEPMGVSTEDAPCRASYTLDNGDQVLIGPPNDSEKGGLVDLYKYGLDDDGRHSRFFTGIPATQVESHVKKQTSLENSTGISDDVAVRGSRVVGHVVCAEYDPARLQEHRVVDIGLVVARDSAGMGIGRALLGKAFETPDVDAFRAEVLSYNRRMNTLFRRVTEGDLGHFPKASVKNGTHGGLVYYCFRRTDSNQMPCSDCPARGECELSGKAD